MRPLLYLAEDAHGDIALWQDVPEGAYGDVALLHRRGAMPALWALVEEALVARLAAERDVLGALDGWLVVSGPSS